MVKYLLRENLGFWGRLRWRVESAGTSAGAGKPITFDAKLALAEKGIASNDHLSRRVTQDMLAGVHAVVCLTESHLSSLQQIGLPATVKVFTLSVPDPFGQPLPVYQKTRHEISRKLVHVLAALRGKPRDVMRARLETA